MTEPRYLVIVGLTLGVIVATYFLPPIPQKPAYHLFADQRTWFGVSNFLDVISNFPLLLVGSLGLISLPMAGKGQPGPFFIEPYERLPYLVFFLGITLTSFGSTYYHLSPDNARLVWDRLPLSLIFTSFTAAIIAERIGAKAGLVSLLVLMMFGMGSVVYWYWSEVQGAGDMRIYLLLQAYPVLLVPLLAILFPAKYTRGWDLLGAAGFYAAAKVFEVLDREILDLGRIVSGHTLKHLVSAVAGYWILRMLRKRRPSKRVKSI